MASNGSVVRWLMAIGLAMVIMVPLVALTFRTQTQRTVPTVLLVGDSVLAAATSAVAEQTPTGVDTAVMAGPGASPCDMWLGGGYGRAPKGYLSFESELDRTKPRIVVLAFTGNPGFPGTGCVDANANYPLNDLLSRYRTTLGAMGSAAARRGAVVFLAATPPRNPAALEGWVAGQQHNYNGDPAINLMLQALAGSHGWRYDDTADRELSAAGGSWTEYLTCQPADGSACVNGMVQVRTGGGDAIHCNVSAYPTVSPGSLRFAYGLLVQPLEYLGRHPLGLDTPPACR